jgi:hypothetical protein
MIKEEKIFIFKKNYFIFFLNKNFSELLKTNLFFENFLLLKFC